MAQKLRNNWSLNNSQLVQEWDCIKMSDSIIILSCHT